MAAKPQWAPAQFRMIVVMKEIKSDARAVEKRYENEVDAVVRKDGAAIAKIRFATEKARTAIPTRHLRCG